MKTFFGNSDYNRIYRKYTKELDAYFWNYIIVANRFSKAGGEQLVRDVEAIGGANKLVMAARILALDQDDAFKLKDTVDRVNMVEFQKTSESLKLDLSMDQIRRLLERRADIF